MPEEYEEEEAKEFANSKIGFFVNLIAENDQLLTKYFENDRGIFFKQCIFYKWIQDEEWEKISEYIVKSLMAFDDQNNKFDYGYMNMLSPYMDGDLTGEYMDRTDQWGRIIKIINESNIEKFVDALCKASAMTVGCENHEKYHKEIAHMCFEYLSEESIDRIKAEIRRMCPNEDGTDEYIQKLLDDVKIYCTFPKPRGKGGAAFK